MVKALRKIVWDKEALIYLKQSLDHIKADSPLNADVIKNDIRKLVKAIPEHPNRYPADRYREHNDGSYRVLTVYNFRISYFISISEIRIVRIRHSKQQPLLY